MIRSLRPRLFGGKKLTFLYVPDNASVRQFLVPRLAVYAVGCGLLVVLGLSGFFGSRYLTALADGHEMLRLRAENQELRGRVERMGHLVASLQDDVKVSEEYQQQLRTIASLQPLTDEVLQAGVGGPSPAFHPGTALSPELRGRVDDLGARLDKLLRQTQIQRQSYEEIRTALLSKRDVWDHTPSIGPLGYGTLTSRYGRRMDPFTGYTAMHRGVDFAAQPGTAIHATANGVVTMAERWGTYGLTVEIDHGDGLRSRYAHCMSLRVQVGQKVMRKDIIALVGSSGKSSGTHVHYEVIKDGLQQNPLDYVLSTDVIVD